MTGISIEAAQPAMPGPDRTLAEAAERLSKDDLAERSRCRGWTRAGVLFHVPLDVQRALVTFAAPAAGQPDVDCVWYWEPFKPGQTGAAGHARFVRRAACHLPEYRVQLRARRRACTRWCTRPRRGRRRSG